VILQSLVLDSGLPRQFCLSLLVNEWWRHRLSATVDAGPCSVSTPSLQCG